MTWGSDVCLKSPVTSPTRSRQATCSQGLRHLGVNAPTARRQRLLVFNRVKWHCHLSLRRHGGKFRYTSDWFTSASWDSALHTGGQRQTPKAVRTLSEVLPWLRFFRAFSSVVRQIPGYDEPRRGTARTLPKLLCCSMYYLFCIVLCIVCV